MRALLVVLAIAVAGCPTSAPVADAGPDPILSVNCTVSVLCADLSSLTAHVHHCLKSSDLIDGCAAVNEASANVDPGCVIDPEAECAARCADFGGTGSRCDSACSETGDECVEEN